MHKSPWASDVSGETMLEAAPLPVFLPANRSLPGFTEYGQSNMHNPNGAGHVRPSRLQRLHPLPCFMPDSCQDHQPCPDLWL